MIFRYIDLFCHAIYILFLQQTKAISEAQKQHKSHII